jgi:hypothetical protein
MTTKITSGRFALWVAIALLLGALVVVIIAFGVAARDPASAGDGGSARPRRAAYSRNVRSRAAWAMRHSRPAMLGGAG